MKKFKWFTLGVVFTLVLSLSFPSLATVTQQISVIVNATKFKVNGVSVTSDVFNYEGKNYVPVRNIAEMCGKVVSWDSTTNTVNIDDKIDATPSPSPSSFPTLTIEPAPTLSPNSIVDIDDSTSLPQEMEITNFLFKSTFRITINKIEQDDESLRLYVNYKYLDGLIDMDFYEFYSIVVSCNGKTYSSIDWEKYKTKISRPGEMKVKDSVDGITYFSPISNVDKIDIGISNHYSSPNQIYTSIKNIKVKNNEIINSEVEPLNAPLIKSKEELKRYLESNFSVLNTSMGKANFTFDIYENTDMWFPYDYDIKVGYDIGLFKTDLDSIKYTQEQKEKFIKQVKDFQEKIGRTVIKAMPDKKVTGSYYYSYYKYPTLKIDLVVWKYYGWCNYIEESVMINNSKFDHYNPTKPSSFRWIYKEGYEELQ